MQRSTRVRILGLFGLLGPIIYLIAVIVGGMLWQGYSHYSQTVSTLTSTGAPNQEILVPLFALYNICVILLAVGLYLGVNKPKLLLGPPFLAMAGTGGLVLFFFPQDPMGPPVTLTGTMHVVIAGLIASASIISMAAFALQLRHVTGWAGYAHFSMIMLLVTLVLGPFGAISITAPYAGLAERLSIGAILIWIEVMAVGLVTRKSTKHT